MAVVYRIYTEQKNLDEVYKIVGRFFEAYNTHSTVGVWQGKHELSLTIEIVDLSDNNATIYVDDDTYSPYAAVFAIAGEIKTTNEQQAVLITFHNAEAALV